MFGDVRFVCMGGTPQVNLKKLDEKDPLIKLTQLIDWEMFRSTLEKVREKERKSKAGRKPYDVVLMFKVLI